MFEWRLVTGCCLSGDRDLRDRCVEAASPGRVLEASTSAERRASRSLEGNTAWHRFLRDSTGGR